jgi:uncharacterized Tic20 family protein
MTNWYYYDQTGKKCGPVDSGTLKILAQHGIITPSTTITNSEGKGSLAGGVKGLEFPRSIPSIPVSSVVQPQIAPSSQFVPPPYSPILQNSNKKDIFTWFGMESKTYFMLMHIMGFLFFPVVIVMWAVAKDKDVLADIHGKIIFNWLLSLLFYAIIVLLWSIPFLFFAFDIIPHGTPAFVNMIVCIVVFSICIVIFPILAICVIVFPFYAAYKASKGEVWKYRYSFSFFRVDNL